LRSELDIAEMIQQTCSS